MDVVDGSTCEMWHHTSQSSIPYQIPLACVIAYLLSSYQYMPAGKSWFSLSRPRNPILPHICCHTIGRRQNSHSYNIFHSKNSDTYHVNTERLPFHTFIPLPATHAFATYLHRFRSNPPPLLVSVLHIFSDLALCI